MNCRQLDHGHTANPVLGYNPVSDYASVHNAGGPGFEAVFAIAT